MDARHQFIAFMESIRTPEHSGEIDAILAGHRELCEAWDSDYRRKLIYGILSRYNGLKSLEKQERFAAFIRNMIDRPSRYPGLSREEVEQLSDTGLRTAIDKGREIAGVVVAKKPKPAPVDPPKRELTEHEWLDAIGAFGPPTWGPYKNDPIN